MKSCSACAPGIYAGVADRIARAHAQEGLCDWGVLQHPGVHSKAGSCREQLLPRACLPDEGVHLPAAGCINPLFRMLQLYKTKQCMNLAY